MKRQKWNWLVPTFIISVFLIGISVYGNKSVSLSSDDANEPIVENISVVPNVEITTVENVNTPYTEQSKDIISDSKSEDVICLATPISGVIGISAELTSDNPSDNLFIVDIPEFRNTGTSAILSYEINGVKGSYGVSKSINDRLAYGGYVISQSSEWIKVSELIDVNWLVRGKNRILFTAQDSISYSVRNIQISFNDKKQKQITLSSAVKAQNGVYIHGFVDNGVSDLYVNGNSIEINDNEFETIINSDQNVLNITATNVGGYKISHKATITESLDVLATNINNVRLVTNKSFAKSNNDSIKHANTSIVVNAENISKNLDMSITSLQDRDIPPLNYGMSNVTADDAGYRFLPHGTHFDNDGAIVSLKYDRTKIPSGYTEDDIRTFYFDNDSRKWIALDRIDIDKDNMCVVSQTTHFTDMIIGVIQAPESPETEGFTPTMMNDIKIANPATGLNIIAPPTANNRGSANLTFPIETPPARNGMAPNLAISYNSDINDGFLGEGWDLNIPAISVDTRWGVPRYDNTKETETYLLNGAMLCASENGNLVLAHRTDFDRDSDRQFYTRIGGDFSRIIRKGNSPSNYTWEVTDKRGVKYTYGGDGAVLKGSFTDVNGNTKEVIAEWKLSRIEETHGDYITFSYDIVNENAIGGLTTKAIYLKEVKAYHKDTNSGNPHTVITLTRGANKNVKTNNARYGFLTSSNSLLENISVNFRNELLRSYSFEYETGVFDRTLLSQIKQFDCEGELVSFHKFNYFDDLNDNGKIIPYHSETSHNISSDNIGVGLQKIGTKSASILGSSESSTSGNSFYAGIGGFDGSPTKSATGGMSVGYSENKTEGKVSLMDLNGDGLPDKVYKANGNVYYRAQSVTDTNAIFESPIEIPSLNHISKSYSSTTSTGLKGNIGWGPIVATAGGDYSSTKTETTGYFSDVNGDGLPDYVSDGRVYFNRLVDNIPTFSTDISGTSNPITYSGIVNPDSIFSSEELLAEQDSLMKKSPMLDAVRLWVAPKDGNIIIEGNVQLIQPSDVNAIGYDKRDGVRVAIQIESNEKWSKIITKDDFSSYKHTIATTISKGDRIFFRVQSGTDPLSNGYFDNVQWSPSIRYCFSNSTQTLSEKIMPNGDYSNKFYSSESGVYSTESSTRLVEKSDNFVLKGTISIPSITDDVTLSIIGEPDSLNDVRSTRTLWTKTYSKNWYYGTITLNDTISNSLNYQNLSFSVSSPSNVRWQNLSWKPEIHYSYVNSYDNSTVSDTIKASVKYNTFSNHYRYGSPVTIINPGTSGQVTYRLYNDGESGYWWALYIKPNVQLKTDSVYNGTVTMKVKSQYRHLMTHQYQIVNNKFINPYYDESKDKDDYSNGAIGVILPYTNDPDTLSVWCEFYSNKEIPIASASYEAYLDYTLPEVEMPEPTLFPSGDISCYSKYDDNRFGTLHRGWGAFLYNAGNNRYANPIDIDVMNYDYQSEEYLLYKYDYPNSETPYYLNINETPMFSLNVDTEASDKWVGANKSIYISESQLSSSRLLKDDIRVSNPLSYLSQEVATYSNNQVFPGYTIVSKNSGTNTMYGLTLLSRSDAKTSGTIELTTMDLNGDNYPDIVSRNNINYTSTYGGLSSEKLNWNEQLRSKATSKSYGSGGNPIAAYTSSVNAIKSIKGNTETNKSNANSKGYNISPSLDYSKSTNTDISLSSYVDVNGDGLLDMVIANNETNVLYARINLGYAFSDRFTLTSGIISKSESSSQNIGGGLGFDIGAGSISGGIGAATTETSSSHKLMDINGDGLVDILYIENGKLMVRLNNGIGYNASPIEWANISTLDNSESSSTSLNVAVSAYIPLPFFGTKLIFTPGTSFGKGISNVTSEIRDFNGDGFPDLIEADSESYLKIRKSTIARSNKLKSVVNSLGGKFYLDYEHTGVSTDFPNGKWVMSSLTIDDGIHDDGSLVKNSFDYANGRRDRYEREFLGFGHVITNNINTDENNEVYRKTVQEFDVSNYYVQGNLLSTTIKDANNNPFTETQNDYFMYAIRVSDGKYILKDGTMDYISYYSPIKYSVTKQYEGNTNGLILNESQYEYSTNSHGELISYRYSDKGTLKSSDRYDYASHIGYKGHESTTNIFGLPTSVVVEDFKGEMLRQTSATYANGHPNEITSVTRTLNGSETATTNYTYDDYGNLTDTQYPIDENGDRLTYKYSYDGTMGMYLETAINEKEHFESSINDYDFRYGIPLSKTDVNDKNIFYTVDNLGRILTVLSPMDIPTTGSISDKYTIKFEYYPAVLDSVTFEIKSPAYAITRHYDERRSLTNDKDIETVAFCDGFGRIIQTKKEAMVYNGNASSNHSMIISGKNIYDAFGRIVKSYYPTTESYGNNKVQYITAKDVLPPTTTSYDVLDRTVSVVTPIGTETTTEYSLNGNHIIAKVTDANGHFAETYTNGSGKAVKTVQYHNNNPINTQFEYDGIGQLISSTDNEGNKTSSVYDMAGRRTQVSHPASGVTSFSYDALDNILTKQTANMGSTDFIKYGYKYNKLTSIEYPFRPQNNVYYYYGNQYASDGLRNRIIYMEDGSGSAKYSYDELGNVITETRTVIVPNNGIYTFNTEWNYDSFNRLLDMKYPGSNNETVYYNYDLGGNLASVTHNISDVNKQYVDTIFYDKFGSRAYMKYGNGAVTTYSYDSLRRMSNLNVVSANQTIINNIYGYDKVNNITSIVNDRNPIANKLGAEMRHNYVYDDLYRLISAQGNYNNGTANYQLSMGYDDMHRITSKRQTLSRNDIQFDGTLNVGYNLAYTYSDKNKFQLESIQDYNYRTEGTPTDSILNHHVYKYDANGNMVLDSIGRVMKDGHLEENISKRQLLWDDENRLLAINDNGYVSSYLYNANGDRTVKLSGNNEAVYVNTVPSANETQTDRFTIYPSPYMVFTNGGRYTKHIYIGSERIVSKVAIDNGYNPATTPTAAYGNNTYVTRLNNKSAALNDSIEAIYTKFQLPFNGLNNDDIIQGFQPALMSLASTASSTDNYEEYSYYIHSDHLGSTSYITDSDGEVSQHVEYVPFGEVFIEELSSSAKLNTPFLFNGKELDEETGLYYYGARYYDPRTSLWLSTDPMELKYPNVSTYVYCLNNPVKLIDTNGQEPEKKYVGTAQMFINILNNSPRKVGYYRGSQAANYLKSLSNTEFKISQMRPVPTQTGYFNQKKGRYIYTTEAGWIDMAHFMFYAGKAYNYKLQKQDAISQMNASSFIFMESTIQMVLLKTANMDPVGEAIQDGYMQEYSDQIVATHSAFSYEDLPSDKYGAIFGASFFNEKSSLTFGEQLMNYLISLGATNPEEAPNFDSLPISGLETPSRTNKNVTPVYTKDNP